MIIHETHQPPRRGRAPRLLLRGRKSLTRPVRQPILASSRPSITLTAIGDLPRGVELRLMGGDVYASAAADLKPNRSGTFGGFRHHGWPCLELQRRQSGLCHAGLALHEGWPCSRPALTWCSVMSGTHDDGYRTSSHPGRNRRVTPLDTEDLGGGSTMHREGSADPSRQAIGPPAAAARR